MALWLGHFTHRIAPTKPQVAIGRSRVEYGTRKAHSSKPRFCSRCAHGNGAPADVSMVSAGALGWLGVDLAVSTTAYGAMQRLR